MIFDKVTNNNSIKDTIKIRIKVDNNSYILMLDKVYQPAAPSNYDSNLFFIKGNLEDFGDPMKYSVRENENGTIDIVIKNVTFYEEK